MGDYGYEIPYWFLTQNVKTVGELLQSETKIGLTTKVLHKSELSKGEVESCAIEENDRKYELQHHKYQDLLDTTKGALLSCNISEQYHSQQPTILLQAHVSTEIDFIDSVLEQLARDVGANLISVDLEDLADVAFEFSRQDFESGFEYPRQDFESGFVYPRQDFETENLSLYGSAESYLSVACESDTDVSDSDWDDSDRNRDAVEAILDAPKLKAENHQSASKSGRNWSKNCPPAFVYIRDAMRIMALGKGKNILKTFRTIIQDRRSLGESMILFVTVFLDKQYEKKEKMILYLRHKLQKGFLSREKPPQEEEMEQMNQQMAQLEKYENLESGIIRTTKINKVLKAIIKLKSIPHESKYNFKERSENLLNEWAPSLGLEGENRGKSGTPALEEKDSTTTIFRRKILVDPAAIVDIAQPNHEGHSRKDELHRTQEINVRRLKRALRGKVCVGLWVDLLDPHAPWDGSMLKLISEALEKSQWPETTVERIARRIIGRIWGKSTLKLDDICEVIRGVDQTVEEKPSNSAEKSMKMERSCSEVIRRMDRTVEDKLSNFAEKLKKIERSCNKYEQELLTCIVDPEKIQVTFDDAIVEQEAKDTVKQLISMSNFRPSGIPHGLLSQIRITGLLLYGPPGTGKTHLTRAIAKKSGASMLTLTAADIVSKWVGETEKYIKAIFSVSAKLAPSVVFIDEVDSLFRRRSSEDRSHTRSATNQFLQEMDGLSTGTGKDSPFVVVATNRPMDLDEAFLRRLPQKIFLCLPSEDNRCRILKTFLKEEDLSPRLSLEALARSTEGFSGSDLRNLCGHAALIFATEQMRAQQNGNTAAPFAQSLLDKGHFEKALERTKPSVSKQTLKEIEEFTRRFNPQSTGHLRRGENMDGQQEIGRRTEHKGKPPFNPQRGFAVPRALEDCIYVGDMIKAFSELSLSDPTDESFASKHVIRLTPLSRKQSKASIPDAPSLNQQDRASTSPTPFHQTCETCHRVLNGISNYPSSEATQPHSPPLVIPFHNIISLIESVSDGCHLCTLVHSGLDSDTIQALLEKAECHPLGDGAEQLAVMVQCFAPQSLVPIIRIAEGGEPRDELANRRWYCEFKAEKIVDAQRREELFTPIPTSTESNSARLALDWLQKCESSHRDCNENRIGPETEFPTRLLYVGLDVRSKVVKLCEAATIKEGARYTTLSHCWGDGVPTRLFSSNYQEFRNGYRLSYLPRTFQEAIKFTRELGIEYVWIDSLCIIQDDEADWGREASRMRDVYACGYLNIAANAADNSNGGLFQSRNPLAVMPFRTQLRWEAAGWVDEDVALFPLGGAFKQLDYAPLTTRAWCVQERLLSRRTVHFTEKQLLWECTTMSGSESDATGAIEKLRRSDDGAIQGWAIAHPVDTMEQVYSSLDKWATAVNLYTRGNLTYQKDKLIAVAGVAKAVQLMFQTPCSYLAGIWNYYAFHWILWEVVGQGSRPADEIAPSWSWASVNGVIHMPSTYRHAERGLVRLSNLYSMKTFPVDDRFGRVNGGFLQVKGSICAIDLIKDAQNPPVYSLAQFQHVEVNMDEAHYQLGARWPTRHHILGWTIEEQLLHPPMSGLILRKTGAKSGEYVRVGMWSVKHFEDIEEWFPGFRAGTAHKVEGWAKCDAESDDFFGILDEFNAMHLKLDEYEEADQASCQYRISIV